MKKTFEKENFAIECPSEKNLNELRDILELTDLERATTQWRTANTILVLLDGRVETHFFIPFTQHLHEERYYTCTRMTFEEFKAKYL